MITRRLFFAGAAASIIASPAIVRAASLMPVRALAFDPEAAFQAAIRRAIEEVNFLQRIKETIIYGGPEAMPLQFTGLVTIPDKQWRKLNYGVPLDD